MATEMATEMATPEKIDPQIVGNAFVEQYYQILHQSPDLVHRFYQDSSVLSRLDANGAMKTVTTLGAINDQIMSIDYKKFKAEIKTADAQQSYNDGVIVLVTGYLTGKDNLRRKFTETFFLAPQEKGFYVLNDIFRYVDENESLEVNSVAVNGINDSTQTVPSTDQEPTHVPELSVLDPPASFEEEEEEDLNNGAEVCDPSDDGEGSVTEEEVVIEQQEAPTHLNQNETPMVINAAPAMQNEAPKKTYASIVLKGHAISNTMYVPTKTVRAASSNTDRQLVGLTKPAPAPEASITTSESAPGSSHSQEEVEGHSIYLRNLPLNATNQQLEEEFKKFGPIKRGGIQVRSNKQTGFCFGFVEFETLSAMHSAIEASPITIGGRQADIEEKRTTTRVGGGGRGRYPSGRGGFRNDNFRGRGNFGGGRGGYGRNEFRNQGGEFSGRPRGPTGRSGEGYQWVDQNGNGRPSSRQGGSSGGSSGGAAAAGSGGGNNSSVTA